MTEAECDALLLASLADGRLSRGERQVLASLCDASEKEDAGDALRERAFALVRSRVAETGDPTLIDWLESVIRSTRRLPAAIRTSRAEAFFSPGEECPGAIERLLRGAALTLDICVFTITDDRLTGAILDAHRRGTQVRILTDDAKAEDLGSDVDRLIRAGIGVRVDRSPFHMHHKFALADGRTLLTGSYNWTRGACRDNEENLIVTDEPRLIDAFSRAFDGLWTRLA